MQTIAVNKQEPYCSFVLDGEKTIEGRLNRGKFASLNVGDAIEMNDKRTLFEVVGKNVYKSFREMLEAEGVVNVVPDKFTLEEAVNVYYKFYTAEEEKEFGVVAIKIKRKNK